MSYNKLIALLYFVILSGIGLLGYTAWLTWDKMNTSTSTSLPLRTNKTTALWIPVNPSELIIAAGAVNTIIEIQIDFDPPIAWPKDQAIRVTYVPEGERTK